MRRALKPVAPALLGTLRRRRRVQADPISTTWEAWDTATGERLLVRILRADAPLSGERLASLPLPAAAGDEGVRFVRTGPVSCALADLLPMEGGPGSEWTARFALGVLAGLVAVHATGHAHGWVGAESVVATRAGWTLAWLGPVPDADPVEDLRALGLLVASLDPMGPIGELVGDFAEAPPPSAADAARLVVHACAGLLARERHALVGRVRALDHASRRARLGALAQRLARAFPPPAARGIVRVDDGGVALRVESDGARVLGTRGLVDGPGGEGFAVWGPDGLDPVGARAVLRAWAADADTRPADAEAALGGLIRWLAAASRLRVDRRLLGARG